MLGYWYEIAQRNWYEIAQGNWYEIALGYWYEMADFRKHKKFNLLNDSLLLDAVDIFMLYPGK